MEKGYEFIVDSREKGKIQGLLKLKNIPHRRTALGSGDFCLRHYKPFRNIVGMERKTVYDLMGSIQNGKMFNQIKRLTRDYDIRYLLISGNLYEATMKMKKIGLKINSTVIYGTIASFAVRDRIHVLWLPDDSVLIDVAYRICTKISEGKYGKVTTDKAKFEQFKPINALTLVPGIKQSLAEKMLDKFKTLKNIADAEVNQLTVVDGIGPEKASLVWRFFNKKW